MSRHPRRASKPSHTSRHRATTPRPHAPRVFTPRPIIGRPGRTPIIGSAALPHHWGRGHGSAKGGSRKPPNFRKVQQTVKAKTLQSHYLYDLLNFTLPLPSPATYSLGK